MTLSSRAGAVCLLAILGAAVAARSLGTESPGTAALNMVLASLAIGVVPGALGVLAWRPRDEIGVLEWLGFGIVVSFGIVQLLTVLAISAHVSPAVTLGLLGAACMLAAFFVVTRRNGRVVVSGDEALVLLLVSAMACTLYLTGAPVDSAEDQIHAGIARRLSQLPNPGFDNVYVTPGIVYTYPFPGTHYFMGLISRLGDIDTLFLYHKIRFFWAFAGVLIISLASRAVFGSAAVAAAVATTSVVFIWNGVFSLGFPTGWGQLVPYSHASDIAMSVLLPCLLAAAFSYMRSTEARERAFLLTATTLLIAMLTMVHMREVVQFAAYLGCFALLLMIVRQRGPYLWRAVGLLALTLGIATTYTLWQAWMVPLVDNIVDTHRAEVLALASKAPFVDLLLAPVSTLFPDLLQKFDQIFITLLPFFLFAGPIVIVVFRREPLVWLLAAVLIGYLLVMSVPILAVPYIYLTYFEILHLPVRNVIFFAYMLAGALVYVAVAALERVDRTRMSLPIAGAAAGALALLASMTINQSHAGFFLPLIAAYALTLAAIVPGPWRTTRQAAILLVACVALVGLWPEREPAPRSEQVTIRWNADLAEQERRALESRFSLGQPELKTDTADEVHVWNYRLSNLSVDNVRAIVEHPSAADTHFIDRSTFEVESQAPPRSHLPWGVRYVKWLQYPNLALYVTAAVGIWAAAFLVPFWLGRHGDGGIMDGLRATLQTPFHRHAFAYALFIVPFALWSVYPSVSPLSPEASQPTGRWATPRQLIAELPCIRAPRMQARFTEHLFEDDPVMLPEQTICPPPFEMVEWMQDNLPPNGVLAIDRWDSYPSVMFSPQQVVVFPTLEASFVREDTLFDEYYDLFYRRMRKYRVQPFFNGLETPDERDEYVRTLGVTHILVNPAHDAELRPTLDALPDRFSLKHAHDRWAIYEVIRS